MSSCKHCQLPVTGADEFCCPGCAQAYQLIRGLNLDQYYRQKIADPNQAPLKPDEEDTDFTPFVQEKDGEHTLHLFVERLHCGSCVWLIERALAGQDNVTQARINMTTRRMVLSWQGGGNEINRLTGLVQKMGYRLRPYDPKTVVLAQEEEQKFLLYCMAVAGFAAGNVMLMSVSLWASTAETMGMQTRALLHWVSALIALPVLVYAGRPFFRPAWQALKARRAHMDVPISLALILTAGVSLHETLTYGEHAYFDSLIMLLFFLLVGRYLDMRARGRASQAATHMALMMSGAASVVGEDGRILLMRGDQLQADMVLSVAPGEKIAADGTVISGASELDTSIITGESLPRNVRDNMPVFAGMVNLTAPLRVKVTKAQSDSLLADVVRMMEQAGQKKSRVMLWSDKIVRWYTPLVHAAAGLTFLGWWLSDASVQSAILTATTVLIITCPCALALAVPAVQVVASGRLFRQGIFLKSGDALERLSEADMFAFDKTGTLTTGHMTLQNRDEILPEDLKIAAILAQYSKHPVSRAITRAYDGALPTADVEEVPGMGVQATLEGRRFKLGKATWCGRDKAERNEDAGVEVWLSDQATERSVRFTLEDALRPDAAEVCDDLHTQGFKTALLSGDIGLNVSRMARAVGIAVWHAALTPKDKVAKIEAFASQGHKPAMVGDGLNDAAALAAAHVSLAPASALDVTQQAADIVFQGDKLSPVTEALNTAHKARRLMRQNITFSLGYNALAVPLAVMGYVTPLVAALAMSGSSLIVILNAFRIRS